ncbi:glycosyltransferase family 4 protein [Rhodoferax ferrireducens]|uniref:glycosyltransferase family 4 protein n=1 Tax=Rhodoferax ferrireducens TaxID=192843 RepID=UPI000E0CD1E1|nr:glycosyltransferase family 4 protein [Rhodoferax ferrireducens]
MSHPTAPSVRPLVRAASQRSTYLFVLPWSLAHLGGVNQVIINLAREMVKSAVFDPIVLIADWSAIDPIWEEVNGLKTVRWRIRPYPSKMGIKEGLVFWLWEQRFCPAFRRFCREHRVAVINPHYPGSTAFALDRITNCFDTFIPLILSFHGTDVNSLRSASADTIAQWRRLLLRVSGVVVCSDELSRRLTRILGIEVVPRVIHNGIDASAFTAMAGSQIPTGERFILNVGKFEQTKGQDVLIEAYAAIADEYADVDLVFIGATDNALTSLQEQCRRKGVAERVHFFPDTPHYRMAEFFQRATVFALPSRQESFGIVLLEAGAFALPVVASRVGGIPEILTDGVTGRLVAPDDPAELALCLRSLLDIPATAQAMGRRLQYRVLTNFTWTAALTKYAALLNEARINRNVSRK